MRRLLPMILVFAFLLVGPAGHAKAKGPCTVLTDPSNDANPGIYAYDPALELTAFRVSTSATDVVVEWVVKDLSAPIPAGATTQVWQAYWDTPTSNQDLLRAERDAVWGLTFEYYGPGTGTPTGEFDLAKNTIRMRIPLSAIGAPAGSDLKNINMLSLHYPGATSAMVSDTAGDVQPGHYVMGSAC